MSRRTFARIVAAAAGITMVVSAAMMASRVAEFHRENRRNVYAFKEVAARTFTYAGRDVEIADAPAGPGPRVVVRYGAEELELYTTIPSDSRLPGLASHQNWLRVFRFAEATGTTLDRLRAQMESGEVRDRLVLVTRSLQPGADPSSRGEVNQKAWTFDFYEFLPDGGFEHELKRFPKKRRADLRTGTVPPAPEDELKENTWQFQAALLVMPPARGPSPQFTNDGLHAMGWTLPATSLSMLTLIAAVVFAARPRGWRVGAGSPGS